MNCRLPGVIGFVDGTHIAIAKPADHEELYINRKGFHSVNAQIVGVLSSTVFKISEYLRIVRMIFLSVFLFIGM